MSSLRKSILGIALSFSFGLGTVHAGITQLVAAYDYQISRFLPHPSFPRVYASNPATNSIIAIDTNTLAVVSTTAAGGIPGGMAVSLDGTRLYVANSGTNSIGVLDAQTGAFLRTLTTPENARDVEVGRDGRLYVLGDSSLIQMDPDTGANIGLPGTPSILVYSGEMAISPDKQRLYYGDYGLSPASLYQIDVSSDIPRLLWESPHGGTSGENGQDLAISHDGSFVSYAAGVGQLGYSIAKYRTSDMSIEGSFETGAYPEEITFSPDGKFVYTVSRFGAIDVWDTLSFGKEETIAFAGNAVELEVDTTGRYLFAATGGFGSAKQLLIFETGRSAVPEPSSCVLTTLAVLGLLSVNRRSK